MQDLQFVSTVLLRFFPSICGSMKAFHVPKSRAITDTRRTGGANSWFAGPSIPRNPTRHEGSRGWDEMLGCFRASTPVHLLRVFEACGPYSRIRAPVSGRGRRLLSRTRSISPADPRSKPQPTAPPTDRAAAATAALSVGESC